MFLPLCSKQQLREPVNAAALNVAIEWNLKQFFHLRLFCFSSFSVRRWRLEHGQGRLRKLWQQQREVGLLQRPGQRQPGQVRARRLSSVDLVSPRTGAKVRSSLRFPLAAQVRPRRLQRGRRRRGKHPLGGGGQRRRRLVQADAPQRAARTVRLFHNRLWLTLSF